MAPEALSYTYTTRAYIERLMGELGVRLRLDHDGDGQVQDTETDALDDVISLATETVNFYCWPRYNPARLAESNLVWHWTTILAAYHLDQVRNNPPSESLAMRAEEIQEKLEAVQAGRAVLPGVPLRMTGAPKMANVRVDQRYTFRVIRVERGSSKVATPVIRDYPSEYSQEM